MKRTEVSFAELQIGDTVVRITRTGQTPSVVSEVFTLKSGEKAFRVEGHDNPGVYYKEAKFVLAYRESDPPKTELQILLEKVNADIAWHYAQMERIDDIENATYNFHLGWVDSMTSMRLSIGKML